MINQPTTTTTTYIPTTTIRPYIPGNTFCFSRCKPDSPDTCLYYTFESADIVNGYNSWTSDTLSIYYVPSLNRWVLTGYTGTLTASIISTDPPRANPPVNWQVLGTGSLNEASVSLDVCTAQTSTFMMTVTNSTCSSSNDGSVVVVANGGAGPYVYSRNGGLTYQSSPVFSNLAIGQYTIVVKDTTTDLTSSQVATIFNDNSNRSFAISFGQVIPSTIYTPPDSVFDIPQILSRTIDIIPFTLVSNPVLQIGETITFNFVFTANKIFKSPGSVLFTNNIILNKNGTPLVPISATTTNTVAGVGVCSANTITTTNTVVTYTGISITYGDTISGSFYSKTSVSAVTSISGCKSIATKSMTLQTQNLTITPQNCRTINNTTPALIQLTNNLQYLNPPLELTFLNRWVTAEESLISGFTYGGNVNSPTSPGTSPRLAYNFINGCLTQDTTCFPIANTISGGPVLINGQNQLTVQQGTRGAPINLWLKLGGAVSGGACVTIFGRLKVSVNSGAYTTLTTLNGGSGCSSVYSYIIPLNANTVEFSWEQNRI